jgi:hypothetical protein
LRQEDYAYEKKIFRAGTTSHDCGLCRIFFASRRDKDERGNLAGAMEGQGSAKPVNDVPRGNAADGFRLSL